MIVSDLWIRQRGTNQGSARQAASHYRYDCHRYGGSAADVHLAQITADNVRGRTAPLAGAGGHNDRVAGESSD